MITVMINGGIYINI